MKLSELAALTGKSVSEVKDMLNQQDVVEVKLSERSSKFSKDHGNIEVMG